MAAYVAAGVRVTLPSMRSRGALWHASTRRHRRRRAVVKMVSCVTRQQFLCGSRVPAPRQAAGSGLIGRAGVFPGVIQASLTNGRNSSPSCRRRNQHRKIGFRRRWETPRRCSASHRSAAQTQDQHVLGKPALSRPMMKRAQRKAFFPEQRIAAVSAAERPDLLGSGSARCTCSSLCRQRHPPAPAQAAPPNARTGRSNRSRPSTSDLATMRA